MNTPASSTPDTDAHSINGRALPDVDLRHLLRLTDDTGLIQHAIYATPDANHGYCIDDNARALIAGLYDSTLHPEEKPRTPLHTYLAFLSYAFNETNGRFRNFMGYDRRWLEDEGSHDSQGRTLWALGLASHLAPIESDRALAQDLYRQGLPGMNDLDAIRSWAFALLGLIAYLGYEPNHADTLALRDRYANQLFAALQKHATDGWPWWEDLVTYDNAKLCHALLLAGESMGNSDMQIAAIKSLRWLLDQQTAGDADRSKPASHLSIIGNDGWLTPHQARAPFDQQPLEAYAMLDACLDAARLASDAADRKQWEADAWFCFDWFLGRNDLDAPLFDPETGGCKDGLNPTGPNKNQGAESSLAYLISVLELHRHFTL